MDRMVLRLSYMRPIRSCLTILAMLAFAFTSLADRPNVVMFVVDDLNDWVTPLGDTQAITPNLDRLAKRGVTFTNAHTPGVYCAPARTAIWTGLHASTTGCYSNQVYHYDKPTIEPLQLAFKKSGYKTYGGGKLYHHGGGYLDRRGWDEFFLHNESHKQEGWKVFTWDDPNLFPQPHPSSPYNQDGRKLTGGLFQEWGSVPNGKAEQMADSKRTNWAVDKIKRQGEEPFFLAVGLYAPHYPHYAPEKYFALYDRDQIKLPPLKADDAADLPEHIQKRMRGRDKIRQRLVELGVYEDAMVGYLACVSYADAMLGRVLDALDQSDHADNTIVVLWSDHGYHLGEKGQWGKHTLWQRTSGVPMIVAGGEVAKNRKVDATVSLIDLYPTFVEMCGLEKPDRLDGTSIASTLRDPGSAKDRSVLLPYMDGKSFAVINRDWRYIRYHNGAEELYDLKNDPNEWHNLANKTEHSALKKQLAAQAPDTFAPLATEVKTLRLVTEGTDFRWETKPVKKSKP